MDLKVSPMKSGGLSPDYASDPDEKEVSDDDDRNHKHRRRETRSQSLETDVFEPAYTRPYKRRNKPFENGHPFRENESQMSGTWKNHYMASREREFTTKFAKRHPGLVSLSQGPVDLNPRIRANHTFYGDPGPGWGRGRDSGTWNQGDSRLNLVNVASQMVQHGSIIPSVFAGSGLPNVSNQQSSSWNAFGLISRIPNGGLETLHPIGFHGTLRPALRSSINIAIPRPRCRDFEEQGFCLRGDMCPMEHGVNRIVVEDVQSLSQFNLPVSLPSAQLLGASVVSGALPSVAPCSTGLTNRKEAHSKTSKPGANDASQGSNGAFSGSAAADGADLYDPDEPLWNKDGPKTSSAIPAPHSLKNDESEPLMGNNLDIRLNDDTDGEFQTRSTGVAVGSQSTSSSVWGRIAGSRGRLDMKQKGNLLGSTSKILEDETKNNDNVLAVRGTSLRGTRIVTDDSRPRIRDWSVTQSDVTHNVQRSSQKALRTLFVNGIPQKSNRREALLSHFEKFGEVIDIHIPVNGERAFVQFSRREEAEAALRSPDAVMGNRFIKLWWANRDSIPDDVMSSTGSIPVTPIFSYAPSAQLHPPVATKGRENLQSSVPRSATISTSDASLLPSDYPKPGIVNGPKVPPPLQKKLELEQLKEELRKKQEMLEQKRNDFRRQLDKFEKQASGVKGELPADPSTKTQKSGVTDDGTNATTPRSTGIGTSVASLPTDIVLEKNKSVDSVISSSPKANAATKQQDFMGSSQPICLTAPARVPFLMNRYKLDNRPTALRIMPPLPSDLSNVDELKQHFSSFGEVSSVELEDIESCDDDGDGSEQLQKCSAHVNFTTHHSAMKAFVNGKCWQGNTMQFLWVTSASSSNDARGSENSLPASACAVVGDTQPAENLISMNSIGASLSKDGDPENCATSIVKNVESNEISQLKPRLTLMSSHGESSEPDVYTMAMSEGEE